MPISWVVKLGGSFWDSPRLPLWLAGLARHAVVLVPGGGPFADAVRQAQARWEFDDRLAHALAIRAMSQYGRMLQGLCPSLAMASDTRGLRACQRRGQAVIWLPDADQLVREAIPASWSVSSDSLAAWLAERLPALQLLLVKSAEPPAGTAALPTLIQSGLLDSAFPDFTRGWARPVWVSGPGNHGRLPRGLEQPERVFTRVTLMPSPSFWRSSPWPSGYAISPACGKRWDGSRSS